jgi:hypothetical protein
MASATWRGEITLAEGIHDWVMHAALLLNYLLYNRGKVRKTLIREVE